MEKIVLLSLVNFKEKHLDKLRAVSPRLEIKQKSGLTVEKLPSDLRKEINILYGWGEMLYQAHLCPHLKWIQTHSAGVDDLLDKPLWREKNILLSTVNGIHSIPMAEHALALILAFRWRLRNMLRFQSQSTWPKKRWKYFIAPELRGSTLGIIGYGAIGRELARQAHALGMRILALNRSGERKPYQGFEIPGTGDPEAHLPETIYPSEGLLQMLSQSDYVVTLIPLTSQTHHMLDKEAFKSMKSTAYFFNLARGSVVDETALLEALQQDEIAGAGLDVFEEEPLPSDHPLWQMENVIVSPHISGFTLAYDDRASDLFAENLRRYLASEPLINQVEREKGY